MDGYWKSSSGNIRVCHPIIVYSDYDYRDENLPHVSPMKYRKFLRSKPEKYKEHNAAIDRMNDFFKIIRLQSEHVEYDIKLDEFRKISNMTELRLWKTMAIANS